MYLRFSGLKHLKACLVSGALGQSKSTYLPQSQTACIYSIVHRKSSINLSLSVRPPICVELPVFVSLTSAYLVNTVIPLYIWLIFYLGCIAVF